MKLGYLTIIMGLFVAAQAMSRAQRGQSVLP